MTSIPRVVMVDGREYAPIPLAPHSSDTLGGYLRRLRLDLGLSLDRAAALAGMDRDWLEAVEASSRAFLYFAEFVALADLYGVSLDLIAAAHRNVEKQVGAERAQRAAADLEPQVMAFEDDEGDDDDEIPQD